MPEHPSGTLLQLVRPWVVPPLLAVIVLTVGAESAVIAGGTHVVGAPGLLLVLVASAGWALVVSDERAERHPLWIAIAIGTALAIGLVVPPRDSHDLWSYVMYGRMVSVHHMSPYTHVPIDFRLDPFFGRVGAGWRHAVSVYGPLFTVASAALTRIAGGSALRERVAFQGLATMSVVVTLVLIWRTTHSARALAFLGLHPAVITAIGNGGHNDALVGLAIVAGTLLVSRKRWAGAGFVIGLGILVKASGLIGLVGLGAWSFRRDRRGTARLVAASAGTTAIGYAPAGISAVRAVAHAGNGNTRASVWDPISSLLHPNTTTMLVGMAALTVIAAFGWRAARRPQTTTLAVLAASLVGGVYVLAWYPAWALPTAALERRSRLSALVAAHAAFLVAVYEYERPNHTTLHGAWGIVRDVIVQAGAWTALALFVALLARAWPRQPAE